MDRLISEKQIIDTIKTWATPLQISNTESTQDFWVEDVCRLIKAIPSAEPKWIPVSERLPTEEEYIANNGLFIVSDGNRTYAEYFDVYCSMRFGEPTMSGFRIDRCVAAWMPLPKPYEPQESEDT